MNMVTVTICVVVSVNIFCDVVVLRCLPLCCRCVCHYLLLLLHITFIYNFHMSQTFETI